MDLTVLLTTYNRAPFLQAALDSLQGQTLSRWRCILIDDGSDDPAQLAVLDSIRSKRVKVIRKQTTPEERATTTRYSVLINEAYGLLGETGVVVHMCDNVTYDRQVLQQVVEWMDVHPEYSAGYVMHDRVIAKPDGGIVGPASLRNHWPVTPPGEPRPIDNPRGYLDHSQVFVRWPCPVRWEEGPEHRKAGDAAYFEGLVRWAGPIMPILGAQRSREALIYD